MIETLLPAAATIFLAGLGARLAVAGWREIDASMAARRSAEAERAILAARVAEIAERRTREREKAERTWDGFRKFVVARKVLEARDTCSFYLEPHDRRPLPGFNPGQYLTFRLPIPGRSKPVTRCYSLSDAPHADYFRVTIKRIAAPPGKPEIPAGVASCYFHDEIDVGDIVDVRAPAGGFWLDPADTMPVVLIGGGVGLTPVLSMLNAIVDANARREVWFFYGVRNGAEHAMADHLRAIANRNPNVSLNVCYSDPDPGEGPGDRFQHVGRVSVDLIRKVVGDLANPHFYLCGPPPMMKSLVEGLGSAGVPGSQIHHEAFGPASVKGTAAPAAVATATAGSEIGVTFARTGKRVTWNGAATILEMAESAGIVMESGCRAGNCGACTTAVRLGEVAYPSPPGADVAPGSCLACVGMPSVELEIDA